MHPILTKAYTKLRDIVNKAQKVEERNARITDLKSMSKLQLINIILQHEDLAKPMIRAGDLYGAILSDPDCVWLSYDEIAAALHHMLPALKVSSKTLSFHSTYLREDKGLPILSRKPARLRNKLLLSE